MSDLLLEIQSDCAVLSTLLLYCKYQTRLSSLRATFFSLFLSIMRGPMVLMGTELGHFFCLPTATSAFSNNAGPSHSIQISHKRPRISRTSSNTCQGFSSRPSEPLFNSLWFPHLLKQTSNRTTDPQIQAFSKRVLRSPASSSLPFLIQEKTTTSLKQCTH